MSGRGKLLGMGRGMGRGKARQPGTMANGMLGTHSAPSSTGENWGDDPAPMNGSATTSSSTWNPAPASTGDWDESPTYGGDSHSSSTSGFGRSRNGDGGSRSKGCFNCGEEGHMSRDCPSAKKSSSACFKCGEEGHISRDCPKGNTSGRGGGSKACFKCGEEGHMSRDCPNADSSGRGGGGGSRACYKCGEDGHMARDCPQGGGERRGDREKKGCFRCGGDGHMARDCPELPAEGEKPRENYIPPDSSQEDLFENTISAGINFAKYDEIPVEVTGRNPVGFISSFEEAGFFPTCMSNVRKSHYDVPTPVQKYAIPIIMAGRDLMACAQTGSGKTAAFLLPVITGIVKTGIRSSAFTSVQLPQAVVVAPTRELAVQIHKDAVKFSSEIDLKCVVLYGGTSVQHQAEKVRNGCNIVVGTPGRLLDFITRDWINLSEVQYLILDEADRMLDMGFEPEIRKLVGNFNMPKKENRQTLMFSATFPEDIQRLAADFLNDYLFVTVGRVGGANTDVTQMFHEVEPLSKREKLCTILSDMGQDRVLVFVEQKRNADFLASFLSTSGFPTTSIHGDRLQREREEALRDFKNGSKPVLIATSVAARGLDIRDVKHVINYDLPSSIDEYVHRIGRTGRCGNLGKATSFFSSNTDIPLASSLVKILAEARQEVPDWLHEYASNRGGGDAGYNSHRFASTDIRRGGRGGDSYSNHASSAFGGGDDDGESWD